MEERISAWEARRQFGSVLRKVSTERTSVIVESHGEPIAAIVPMNEYEPTSRKRERLLTLLREAQLNANMSEDEAMELALEEQREARKARQ
ncbi:MAG: type II toxin-antitoxin system Phd/YefM family antitoxin [Thermomicrobiales bacterium]|nr:type II toxin-antitoxin system Phd/YefM family antitoxin [Thermomicrobiales bacterium]